MGQRRVLALRRDLLVAAFLIVMSGPAPAAERQGAEATTKPDVAVIMLDTLRPDHLRAYGYERRTAPFLTELAERSTVFLRAVSTSSWTAPSTASLFTSAYPNRHGVVKGFFTHRLEQKREKGATTSVNRLADDLRTLPEILRANGYRTFGVAANLNIGSEIGFDRGFDRFARLGDPAEAESNREYAPAEEVLDRMLQWKKEIESSRPHFLYLHFNDPHGPFHQRAPWYREFKETGKRRIAAYDSEIAYVDAVIRQAYDKLGLEDAIVVVVSDHGNAFGEHGLLGHGPGTGLFAVVNRIVLMVSAPRHGIAARRVQAPVSIIDVLPTLLALCGLPPIPEHQGWALRPLLQGSGDADEMLARLKSRVLFAHVIGRKRRGDDVWAIMRDDRKLIREDGTDLLFDSARDARERTNLASSEPEVVASLAEHLSEYLASTRAGGETKIQLDDALLERLRALGYAE